MPARSGVLEAAARGSSPGRSHGTTVKPSRAVSRLLTAAAATASSEAVPDVPPGSSFRVGVDLGTASCVLVVLARDADGGPERPVWVASHPSGALADGVVVD
ncbi:MAG: ethanolamine utilization protein EutJ family protein, partial [Klenkia sp.]|nr:ethanolamine utilization protein EutJ family protein [Klenkia sp.]